MNFNDLRGYVRQAVSQYHGNSSHDVNSECFLGNASVTHGLKGQCKLQKPG